jgi:hypothetical protein
MEEHTHDRPHDPHMQAAREHMRAARRAMHKSMEALVPPAYVENRRAAKREFLLAVRSMIDSALDRATEPSNPEVKES